MTLSPTPIASDPSPGGDTAGAGKSPRPVPPELDPRCELTRRGSDFSPGTFYERDGKVFDERGFLVWPALCHGLLGVYERAAAVGDWWSPHARRLYLDLYDAMKAAGLIEQELAA